MTPHQSLARLLRSYRHDEPFGWPLLRGLTLSRMGLVAAICALANLRGVVNVWFHGAPAVLPWLAHYVAVTANQFLMMFPLLLLVTIVDNLTANARTPLRVVALAAAVIAGAALFALAADLMDPGSELAPAEERMRVNTSDFFMVLSWGGLLTGALFFVTRAQRAAAATQQSSLDRIDLDAQMAEARIQLLQAQIEQHFLFNSLANVQGLYRQDREKARRLLDDLTRYLRAALPKMRDTASTLQREVALSEAYLRVLQVRMGKRLTIDIAVPDALRDASMPPMILPTLVENAVKHGVAPVPAGGTVRIGAEQVGARLRVLVSDDGAGFRRSSGAGVGLANSRARLARLYGGAASLALRANPTAGVTATLELPLQIVSPGADASATDER